MATIYDYGAAADPLSAPPLGGPSGWAAAVADKFDATDATLAGKAEAATVGNLLTAAQTTLTGGISVGNGSGATVSDPAALNGSAYELTLSGANAGSLWVSYGSASVQTVRPGDVVTAHAKIKAGTLPARVALLFYNNAAGLIGGINYGNTVTNTSAYEASQVSMTAPAGTVYVLCRVYSVGGGAGTTFRVDRLGVWMGAGGQWAMPGTPITGLGQRTTHPNGADVHVQQWDDTTGAWQTVYYHSGVRDVSGLLLNGWSGNLYLRRINGLVTLYPAPYLSAAAKTSDTFVTQPTGFRGRNTNANVLGLMDTSNPNTFGPGSPVNCYQTTAYALRAPSSSGTNTFVITWPTDDPIPTSLPGTLVSPAPA